MGYAVEIFFDSETDSAIRRLWHAIADAGVDSHLLGTGARPHVSLCLYEQIVINEFKEALSRFASRGGVLRLNFSSVGVFPTERVVFVAPVVDAELLDLHSSFHSAFAKYANSACPYYMPGRWVPHCTIAADVAHDDVGKVVRVCSGFAFPKATAAELGLIEYHPIKELAVYPFL